MSTEKYTVIAGWLCEVADGCTCGCGGLSQHEQYCGVQNIIEVDRLMDEHVDARAALARVERMCVTVTNLFAAINPPHEVEDAVIALIDDIRAAVCGEVDVEMEES